jgi:hypothetical protein
MSIRTLKEVYSRIHPAKHVPQTQAGAPDPEAPTSDDLLDTLDREAVEERMGAG